MFPGPLDVCRGEVAVGGEVAVQEDVEEVGGFLGGSAGDEAPHGGWVEVGGEVEFEAVED